MSTNSEGSYYKLDDGYDGSGEEVGGGYDEHPQEEGRQAFNSHYDSNASPISFHDRASYDTDDDTYRKRSRLDDPLASDTDEDSMVKYSKKPRRDDHDFESHDQVECFSPSKELSRQNSNYRDFVSSSLVKSDDDAPQWCNPTSTFSYYSCKEEDSEQECHSEYSQKTNKRSKKENKKRDCEIGSQVSSSSGYSSENLFSSSYAYQGTSLKKPLQGGVGASIMGKMGYEKGKGLGKHGQGRVDPVELSKQKGRQGLGLSIPNLDRACQHWDPDLEVVDAREEVVWLECQEPDPPEMHEMYNWTEEGERISDMSGMTEFCDPDLLRNVLSCKEVFDTMQNADMITARNRCNPFETIRKGIFQNRAAMKMANIDSRFDFMFTNPTNMKGMPMVSEDDLLYFADVCAGPGGFSEYVLWKKQWRAKGIGFTLKKENDFKLDEFKSGPPETFEPYYGSKDDGNVFDPDNIKDLTDFVMNVTSDKGVHFMMADGGFSVEGQENIQELLSKQLYLCQFVVALFIVRAGGHFVCKLFDVFSPFSVGLIYFMYRCFHRVCLFKPNTSRPANSERYIICKWKREETDDVAHYLYEINKKLVELGPKSPIDINECVPLSVLQADTTFFDYVVTSNNKLGERQVVNLAKVSAFYSDTELVERRQADLRKECLALWNVPDKVLSSAPPSVEDTLAKMFGKSQPAFLKSSQTILEPGELKSAFSTERRFSSLYSWQCTVLGSSDKKLSFYLGLGRSHVAVYDSKKDQWEKLSICSFQLSPGTLVLGEIVNEYSGENRTSKKYRAFHIIDAYSLGSEKICDKHFSKRQELCELYCKALHKSCSSQPRPVRMIRPIEMYSLPRIFDSISSKQFKRGEKLDVVSIDDFFFSPVGILFFNTVKAPWFKCRSKSTRQFYFHNMVTRESLYEDRISEVSVSSFEDCMKDKIEWWWDVGVGIKGEDPKEGVIHKSTLLQFIKDNRIKVEGGMRPG